MASFERNAKALSAKRRSDVCATYVAPARSASARSTASLGSRSCRSTPRNSIALIKPTALLVRFTSPCRMGCMLLAGMDCVKRPTAAGDQAEHRREALNEPRARVSLEWAAAAAPTRKRFGYATGALTR